MPTAAATAVVEYTQLSTSASFDPEGVGGRDGEGEEEGGGGRMGTEVLVFFPLRPRRPGLL